MVAGGVLRALLLIEAGDELPVAAPQVLIPAPETLAGVGVLAGTPTEMEPELLGPVAQDRLQQLAVGTGLYQVDRPRVTGELALDRDVAPAAQI